MLYAHDREGGREGGRERGREGGREGVRERASERASEQATDKEKEAKTKRGREERETRRQRSNTHDANMWKASSNVSSKGHGGSGRPDLSPRSVLPSTMPLAVLFFQKLSTCSGK